MDVRQFLLDFFRAFVKSPIKITIGLYKSIRAAKISLKSVTLQSQGKYDEALTTLLKNKSICEGKDCEYHLNMGRILTNSKKDYLGAIYEFQKAIPLLSRDETINSIDRQYLLNWVKYNIGKNFYFRYMTS